MVTKRDFLKMEASLWLNERSQNVAKGWLSTWCCWEAAVHILDWSWKKVDVKLMMMMMMIEQCTNYFEISTKIWCCHLATLCNKGLIICYIVAQHVSHTKRHGAPSWRTNIKRIMRSLKCFLNCKSICSG